MGAVLGVGYVSFMALSVLQRSAVFISRLGRWHVVSRRISRCVGCHGAVWPPLYKRLTVTDFLLPMPNWAGARPVEQFYQHGTAGRVAESSLGLVFQCQAVRDLNPMCFGVWKVQPDTHHPSTKQQPSALLFGVLWWLALKPQPKGVLSGAFCWVMACAGS